MNQKRAIKKKMKQFEGWDEEIEEFVIQNEKLMAEYKKVMNNDGEPR